MTTTVYSAPSQITVVDSSIVAGALPEGLQIQIATTSGGPYSVGFVQIPLTSFTVNTSTNSAVLAFSAFVAACAAATPPITFAEGVDYYCQAELYYVATPITAISTASPESAFVIPKPTPVAPATPVTFEFA